MAEEEIADVIGQIKAGDFDGHLVRVIEAVRLRFTHGGRAQKWKITYDGQEIRQDDLTMGEVRVVEKITGLTWAALDPTTSGLECMAIIAAHLHVRHGKSLKVTRDDPVGEAWDIVSALPMEETIASIGAYEVSAPPKD